MKVIYLQNTPAKESLLTDNNQLIQQLMVDHDQALRRFIRVRSRLPAAECEDVLQEVYEKLLRQTSLSEKLCQRMDTTRNYLFQIATNHLIDRNRRACARKELQHVSDQDISILSTLHAPERQFHSHQQLAELQIALNDLKPEHRTAFLLNRIDGKSYREISDMQGVSISTVEKYISSALLAIRKRVSCR